VLLLAASGFAGTSTAFGSTTAASSAGDLAAALAVNPASVTGASFVARPTGGNPTATATAFGPVGPVDGSSMAVLSTGDATAVGSSQTQSTTVDNIDGGSDVRGAHDVTVLRLNVEVPPTANCLMVGFDFFTEEMPEEFYGSTHGNYLDGFIAELDPTTGWSVGTGPDSINTEVTAAPGGDPAPASDFALGDVKGDLIDGYLMQRVGDPTAIDPQAQSNANGTPYNGATGWRFARIPVSAGAHTLDLSIYDKGDSSHDSVVLLDALRLLRRTPATCQRESASIAQDDVQAPVVSLQDPRKGSKTSDATPRFFGTAGTAAGDGGVQLRVYSGPKVHGAPVAGLSATLSGGSWSATPSKALVTGTYTAQAEQVDSSGNLGLSAPHTFAVVPGTRIIQAKILKTQHRASFTFSATGRTSGFQCALTKSGPKPHFTACDSPKAYQNLKPGSYTFEVRALSSVGAGPAAKKTFTI
jgi:Bacterial Ig-like domain